MELPSQLRAAVDQALAGEPLAKLQQAAGRLSTRYRAETRDGRLHLDAESAVKAYLATRLPATYAAARASFAATSAAAADFSPKTLLDIGAGPGTAFWAAADCWPSLASATMVEASEPARKTGQELAASHAVKTEWRPGDATSRLDGLAPADLVTLAYVLDELAPAALDPLVDRLWALSTEMLIIIEPGTPAGWRRILAARDRLIAAGAHILAPCPHHAPCPLAPPDWCHFSRKVARSRLHRLAKEADVPWEDEKFVYLAASRSPQRASRQPRVIAPPRGASGQVRLKLCQTDGTAAERLFTKREGAAFRAARRVDWGDRLDLGTVDG
jgi:ribosomal protein RSM22 (predicted rRNA methylase)